MVNSGLPPRHVAPRAAMHRKRTWRALAIVPILALIGSMSFTSPSTAEGLDGREVADEATVAVSSTELPVTDGSEAPIEDAVSAPVVEDGVETPNADQDGNVSTADATESVDEDSVNDASDANQVDAVEADTTDDAESAETLESERAATDDDAESAMRADPFVCDPNAVYNISQGGSLAKVGQTKPIGSQIPDVNHANMLGIAPNGSVVYAGDRTAKDYQVKIYKLDLTNSEWVLKETYTAPQDHSSVVLVAGAVDDNGVYYFGGFERQGWWPSYRTIFRVYSYDGENAVKDVGWVYISDTSSTNSNGDIAFDGQGNLYIVRGDGKWVNVVSVTKADLAAGQGGQLPASTSKRFQTDISNISGAAFSPEGKLYVSGTRAVWEYNIDGTSGKKYGKPYGTSTDLATCSKPSTLTIQKYVDQRVNEDDQFTLTLKKGETVISSATTEGSANGLQSQHVGPFPITPGTTYAFAEEMADGSSSSLDQYSPSWECTDENNKVVASSESPQNSEIYIPADATDKHYVCTFTNIGIKPVTVDVTKKVIDESGNELDNLSGWEFKASFGGNVTGVLEDSSQTTDSDGKVSWTAKLNAPTATTSVTLGEKVDSVAGYVLSSFVCTVTEPDKDPVVKEFTQATGNTVADLSPGSSVQCEVTNQRKPGSVTWLKVDGTSGDALAGSVWTITDVEDPATVLTVEDCTGKPCEGLDESPEPGKFEVTGLAWGNYTLVEKSAPQGYKLDETEHPFTIDGKNLAASFDSDFENTRIPGSVTWSKVDDSEPAVLLEGSKWTLTDPDGTSVVVEDCVESSADECTGLDKNPEPGKFTVKDLAWGEHKLTEKSAPLGYKLNTKEHEFEIRSDNLELSLGDLVNEKVAGPGLPLTGGLGSHVFILGGGLLLVLAGGATAVAMRRRTA